MSERDPRRADPDLTPQVGDMERASPRAGGGAADFEVDSTSATPVRRPATKAKSPAPVAGDDSGERAARRDVADRDDEPRIRTTPEPKPKTGRWVAAALAAVIGVAAFFAYQGPKPNTEDNQPNWQYVQKANQANDFKFKTGKSADVTAERVVKGQLMGPVAAIGVSTADRDQATTVAVRTALKSGNPQQVQQALAMAVQNVPDIPPNVKDPQGQPIVKLVPTLSPGLTQAVMNGDADFVHVFLFDSCAEDGDIVEVLLDGVPFANVPIRHQGATVSVPVNNASPTKISLRGVYDGGGGITVGCRTSMGDFFTRSMWVGEVQDLGLARQ